MKEPKKWHEPDFTDEENAWLGWVVRSIIGVILTMLILSAIT